MEEKHSGNPSRPVFIDFCCLPQFSYFPFKGREPEEEERFRACLRNMQVPYTHDGTMVVRLDRAPHPGIIQRIRASGYQENGVAYEERGWCRFERQVSGMKSAARRSASITQEADAAQTLAPLHPDDFNKVLSELKFTSGRADADQVKKLYDTVFSARAAVAKKLQLSSCPEETLESFWRVLPAYKNLEDFTTLAYAWIT